MKSNAALKAITWVLLILPVGIKFLLPPAWETPELKLFANFYIVVLAIVGVVYAAQRVLSNKDPEEMDKKYPWVYVIVIIAGLLICYSNISAFAKTLNNMN